MGIGGAPDIGRILTAFSHPGGRPRLGIMHLQKNGKIIFDGMAGE